MSKSDQFVSQHENIASEVEWTFGTLSPEQLNWKPGPGKWSIAHCIEHVARTNDQYLAHLDNIISGSYRNSLWGRWSPVSDLWGRLLIKAIRSEKNRVKTIAAMEPSSDPPPDILDAFKTQQSELIGKIIDTESRDWKRIVLPSPFTGIVTYNLNYAYQTIIEHEWRHVRQARRVFHSLEV